MKVNLLRMQPDVIIPNTAGLDRYVALIEAVSRRLASDQEVQDATAVSSNELIPQTNEGAAGSRILASLVDAG